MNNNQNEAQFITDCSVMSFDELGIFISDCLKQLKKQSNSDVVFPKQEKTYNELISLLEKKIRDGLETLEIDEHLQYFREKNFYYSKSNHRYEEFTESVEVFIKNLEQIKNKFKALKSNEIPDLDNIALIVKSKKDFSNFDNNVRTEIENTVTEKIISDDMISCVSETLFLLQQNTELYHSEYQAENLSNSLSFNNRFFLSRLNHTRLNELNSFGKLIKLSKNLVEEKIRLESEKIRIEEERYKFSTIHNSIKQNSLKEKNALFSPFVSLNLENNFRNMISEWVAYIESHSEQFQKKDFYYDELIKLQNNLIQKSIEFIDRIISSAETTELKEFEIYQEQIKTNPEVLEQEFKKKLASLEIELKQQEVLILEEPLQKRNEFIISLRSKKRNTFRKIVEKAKFEIIPFDIFPKGSIEISTFLKMLRFGGMSISYEDERRIYKIAEKFPDYHSICRGRNDFDGFVVFRFENTDIVIVEKPSYGNATYLIKGDWEKDVVKILQLSRSAARKQYPKQVKRVIHTSEFNWLSELEVKFRYWF